MNLIHHIFPRSWILRASGGIEIRRLLPATRYTPALHSWRLFSVALGPNGRCHPLRSLGLAPLSTGICWGSKGATEDAAWANLSRLQGRANMGGHHDALA